MLHGGSDATGGGARRPGDGRGNRDKTPTVPIRRDELVGAHMAEVAAEQLPTDPDVDLHVAPQRAELGRGGCWA
jgi:hypothetical protein